MGGSDSVFQLVPCFLVIFKRKLQGSYLCIFLDVGTNFLPTNGFSIRPLKGKLLAGEQKATEIQFWESLKRHTHVSDSCLAMQNTSHGQHNTLEMYITPYEYCEKCPSTVGTGLTHVCITEWVCGQKKRYSKNCLKVMFCTTQRKYLQTLEQIHSEKSAIPQLSGPSLWARFTPGWV